MHQLYSLYSSRTILSKLLDRYGEVDSIKENIPTKTTKGKLQKRIMRRKGIYLVRIVTISIFFKLNPKIPRKA